MGTFTPNYNLFKPTNADLIDADLDIAQSMALIDTILKSASDTGQNAQLAIAQILQGWSSYNPHLQAGGVDMVANSGVIAGMYKLVGKSMDFAIRLTATASTDLKTGILSFTFPASCLAALGANGTFQVANPNRNGQWRNSLSDATKGVMYESGSAAQATVASLALTTGTDMWISGRYMTP